MERKSSKASTTAVTAALPACTPSVTLEARVGSSAIIAWAASTLAASPGARGARPSRLGGPGQLAPRPGGDARADPDAAECLGHLLPLAVEVPGDQGGELVKGLVGAVPPRRRHSPRARTSLRA